MDRSNIEKAGEATKNILTREYGVYHHDVYKTISEISISHLSNIRNHNRQYNSSVAKWIKRTTATQVNIGIRAKPRPEGRPGFLRVIRYIPETSTAGKA